MLEIIKDKLRNNKLRLEHSLGVAEECVRLARHYNLDIKKAETMGLLHDIAKGLPFDEQERLMIEAGYETTISHKIWHAYVGEYICRTELKITDEEILNGIKYHTTCHPDLTPLMKVLMIADMTENRVRDEEMGHKLREMSLNGLNETIAYKLNWMIKRDFELHPDTVRAYTKYKGYVKEE
ncbi:bis(5'-nucleosyl)-tetraphosphatase (symmetrical) YqeK [Mycoplasmatota bacterium zrk1]